MIEIYSNVVLTAGLLTLFAICSEMLRKVVDLHLAPCMMHKRGVEQAKIQDYMVVQATKQRQNLLLQILKLVLDFVRAVKK